VHSNAAANARLKIASLVEALRLCIGRTAHRGSRGIALFFHDHSTRRGWGASVTPRPLFNPEKGPVPIVQEAGWAPGPVWTGADNLAPPGFDPRTVQPVASRYTVYATQPTNARLLTFYTKPVSDQLYWQKWWRFVLPQFKYILMHLDAVSV